MPSEIFKVTSAGSVDDGKSTVLARMLYELGAIQDDYLGADFDPSKLADLLDGLESEKEQGITIDVAHRFFDTKSRRYQLADSPGHEQYTRNMATASAGSDALLLVVDASKGPLAQTLKHLEIALRLGIKDIVFVVNKMDVSGYQESVFDHVAKQLNTLVGSRLLIFPDVNFQVIPVSGLYGDNVVSRSKKLSWFSGPTLVEALDAIPGSLGKRAKDRSLLFQVQLIQRLSGGGRRYLGRVFQGNLAQNSVLVHESKKVKVKQIHRTADYTKLIDVGESIGIELDSQIDISRGDVLSDEVLTRHDQFEIDLIWFSEEAGEKSKRYLAKSGSQVSNAFLTKIQGIDLETNLKTGEKNLIEVNQIARANVSFSNPLFLVPFSQSREFGSLILVSPTSGQTLGLGLVNHHLRRSENVVRQDFDVKPESLSRLTGNRPRVMWFTGLSGSGKSTLANKISNDLFKHNKPHALLDGDNLRLGINRDLGFTDADRTENIRRTAEIAKLMAESGLIVLVCLITPRESDRELAKAIIGEELFELVYVDTPLEICEQRDPKGLYKKARQGEIPNFTGVNSIFEEPVAPKWRLSTNENSSNETLSNLLLSLMDDA